MQPKPSPDPQGHRSVSTCVFKEAVRVLVTPVVWYIVHVITCDGELPVPSLSYQNHFLLCERHGIIPSAFVCSYVMLPCSGRGMGKSAYYVSGARVGAANIPVDLPSPALLSACQSAEPHPTSQSPPPHLPLILSSIPHRVHCIFTQH